MSEALRRIPQANKLEVIRRRIKAGGYGLGFWSAIEAARKMNYRSVLEEATLPARTRNWNTNTGIRV